MMWVKNFVRRFLGERPFPRNVGFLMTDVITHEPKSGLAPGMFTVDRSDDGINFSATLGFIHPLGNGIYEIDLGLNYFAKVIRIRAPGADDHKIYLNELPFSRSLSRREKRNLEKGRENFENYILPHTLEDK